MIAASALPILLPLTLLFAGVIAAMVSFWRPAAAQATALIGAATGFGLALLGVMTVLRRGDVRHDLGGWPPPLGIEYVLDPLSAFMALVITLVGLAVVVYPARPGFGFTPGRGSPLYSLTLLLLAGLLGVVMSGDLFNLFVFLEVYALATYALIALGGDRAVFATLRYLIFGTIGSGFYLLGVGFLYFTTGSLNMAEVAARLVGLGDSPTIIGAVALITVGLALKMALFPLHVWLPDAHSYAPPAVAALLAAVQVKAAAYALVRLLFEVFPPALLDGLPVLRLLAYSGATAILVGSVMAIRQTDFKRLLAYSTVAQLGFIGLGIGVGNPLALVGALLHVLSHAVMKACLFLVAGAVTMQTGAKTIPAFAGLGRRMPLLMGGFAIAALSMVGVPPTAGFFSKWYLLLGSLEAQEWTLAVIIVLSSLLTAAYFLRVFESVFAGQSTDAAVAEAVEPRGRALWPVLSLAAAVIVIGAGNAAVVGGLLDPIATQLAPPN